MSKRFRQRPIEITAIQFVDNPSALEIYQWFKKYQKPGDRSGLSFDSSLETKTIKKIIIVTTRGVTKEALPSDWVIKGPTGFTTVTDEHFNKIYEEVPE